MPGREFEQPIDRLKDFRRATRQRLGDFERDVSSMSRFADRLPDRFKCFRDGAGVFAACAASVAMLEVVCV
jgi:hypothetical protein